MVWNWGVCVCVVELNGVGLFRRLEQIQKQRDNRLKKLREKVHGQQGESSRDDHNLEATGKEESSHVRLFEKEERQAKRANKEKKNTITTTTWNSSLKDSLKVPWYASGTSVPSENNKPIEEQDPLTCIQKWQAQEKKTQHPMERKRKRQDKVGQRYPFQPAQRCKTQPSFIRLDKNHHLSDKNIWDALRKKHRPSNE